MLKPRITEIVAAVITAGTLIVVVVTLHIGARLEREAIDDDIRTAKTVLAELLKGQSQIAEHAAAEPALLGFADDSEGTPESEDGARAAVASQGVHAFLVSPNGLPLAATISGQQVKARLPNEMAAGMQSLATTAAGQPTGAGIVRHGPAWAGYSTLSGRLAIAAAAPLAKADPAAATPDLLVAVRVLDETALRELADAYGLASLSFATSSSAPSGRAILPIVGLTGTTIGALVWRSVNPGRALVEVVAPAAVVVFLIIGGLLIYLVRDVDKATRELIANVDRTQALANADPLTGVANRLAFFEALLEQTRKARRGGSFALMLVDLDRFKEVNDTFGHQTGDRLLADVARRLREVCGAFVTVARIGGDEFAVLVDGPINRDLALKFGMRIIEEVSRPGPIDGKQLDIGASIGIVLAPDHGAEQHLLMHRADLALYVAKSNGRGRATVYDTDLERDSRHRRFIERELRAAILTGELLVEYQPIYAADGKTLNGLEALVRWRHALRGMIPPNDFIPIAEETGLIHKLGAVVLQRACEDAARWPDLTIAVNLSPIQMLKGDIESTVKRVLHATNMAPERLVLEITEGVLVEDPEIALAVINRLRALGCRVALDDFGTGYSSFSYLRRFNFDKLKIDQSFVGDLGESADSAMIVHAIVSLARGLRMTVVAEGVETPEQARFLQATGCHELQGYLLGRPMRAGAIDRLVAGNPEPAYLTTPQLLRA
ncbi:putative bifunctional diguanylate cyclase/phosphodiesterase [Blastochloris sulfoviridis]|uniref:putative bifunctional diguanylate cyclase/phosphodiesterase n=1 Tax=Blastochloris sulfoviridis TaxID=50712 RepID=UPI00147831A6|nr:EAL domain-containing protein [Blastochloris sulfoviridis]